ncbi:hypothetical protein BCR34DRAFT_629298 [Clohesyomyces aquaticus]|uniref:4-amino-5-hydroxymethyl-2-methylpyrimidine phosphate synthase n=1 Tax=Clohesyomyces aquaticus TaxID=1231657 RepID=A0A1Y1Y742_9PLEO|nr:hypothetical protein BCR34DRAFT_629298 [Clohesyomyces aquaticus]
MQPFHLIATGYNLNYLPEYIALRHGFFSVQGLDVSVTISTPWDGVLDTLADSTADIAFSGIWVSSMYRDQVESYTVFAQIANRCPLALLRRVILMKSGGGASVGLFFKMLLREHSIDPKSVDYIQDLDSKMIGDFFHGETSDYFVTDNLSALAIAAHNPSVVYYRETATITPEILDAQKRLCVALEKGIDLDELVELFPNVLVDVAVNITNGFRRDGMWMSTSVSRSGFERWQVGLVGARLVKEPIAYDAIVDDAPANAAQREAHDVEAAATDSAERAQL